MLRRAPDDHRTTGGCCSTSRTRPAGPCADARRDEPATTRDALPARARQDGRPHCPDDHHEDAPQPAGARHRSAGAPRADPRSVVPRPRPGAQRAGAPPACPRRTPDARSAWARRDPPCPSGAGPAAELRSRAADFGRRPRADRLHRAHGPVAHAALRPARPGTDRTLSRGRRRCAPGHPGGHGSRAPARWPRDPPSGPAGPSWGGHRTAVPGGSRGPDRVQPVAPSPTPRRRASRPAPRRSAMTSSTPGATACPSRRTIPSCEASPQLPVRTRPAPAAVQHRRAERRCQKIEDGRTGSGTHARGRPDHRRDRPRRQTAARSVHRRRADRPGTPPSPRARTPARPQPCSGRTEGVRPGRRCPVHQPRAGRRCVRPTGDPADRPRVRPTADPARGVPAVHRHLRTPDGRQYVLRRTRRRTDGCSARPESRRAPREPTTCPGRRHHQLHPHGPQHLPRRHPVRLRRRARQWDRRGGRVGLHHRAWAWVYLRWRVRCRVVDLRVVHLLWKCDEGHPQCG